MKIRFLFYRAKFEFRSFLKTRRIHLVDDAISWWTWSGNIGTEPYAHVEVWTPAIKENVYAFENPFVAGTPPNKFFPLLGTCWTSTMRGENNGTVKRPASEVIKHPERWDYVEIDIPEDDYNRLIYWMELEVENNKGYGKRDIGKFVGLGFLADPERNICSEFTHNAAIVAMIKAIIWSAVKKRWGKEKFPHDFYVWPMSAKIGLLSRFFKVVSPRRFSRMLPGKMQRLAKGLTLGKEIDLK